MDTQLTREILTKVRQVEIRTRRLVDDSLAGQYQSVFKGRGMNFDEVREYVPGDEVRSIDWNVTARTGSPFVKKFVEEREMTILLMIDVSASGDFGSGSQSKRERMAELGSVLAFSAVRNDDRVGLILFTDAVELYIPPAKGRTHILRVIREILFFEPQGRKTDLMAPLDFANRVRRRRAVTFLVSDFCLQGNFNETLDALKPKLQATNRRHDVIAVSVTDPREHKLPNVGLLTLEDSETGEQVELDTRSADLRHAFADMAQSDRDHLRRVIRSSGIDLLELSTHGPYLPTLMSFFGQRERRRWRCMH
ncbi:MAG: DUF58 domain-containing protein [Actinomycetia bacterium]|jgi:uncharacterized protein (DUF58 family)|nr:DUF58 domain-containing protein [Actinomycetes bacterium]